VGYLLGTVTIRGFRRRVASDPRLGETKPWERVWMTLSFDGEKNGDRRTSNDIGLTMRRLTVEGVCRSFDLHVSPGRPRAVIVPNQEAVKRLADVVVGLEPPGHGEVLVDGVPVDRQPAEHYERRAHDWNRRASHQCAVRLVPADGGIGFNSSIVQHIVRAKCPTVSSVPRSDERINHIVASFGLKQIADYDTDRLSPAQRQLVGLASVVCWWPSVVVLEDAPDLPTWDAVVREPAHLDPADTKDLAIEEELEQVALLLISTDAARVWAFDDDPQVLRYDDHEWNGTQAP